MTLEAALMDALDVRRDSEIAEVWRRRFREAHDAGLSLRDATRFAAGDQDIGLLRKLVLQGATPRQIAKIVL